MKKFSPEKELSKIRNGNKKKVIISICALLVVGILGYSFALYQVRHTQKLVFNTVSEFKKRDIYLSVLVDGETKSEFPGKDDGYAFERLDCDKEGTSATFDKESWELVLRTNKPNKCTVVFGLKPNEPELFQGLIPITIDDDGTIKVADTDSEWYNYGDHRWANAVLVDASQVNIKSKYFKEDNTLRDDIAGNQVLMEEVLQMYVWIPRYKYQLWNVNNEGKPKQLINIKFEKDTENTGDIICTYTDMKDGTVEEKCANKNTQTPVQNNEWYTHPAFKFGDTELKGIWVGKFEPSDLTDPNGRTNNVINNLTILPNKTSKVAVSIKNIFNAIRNVDLEKSEKYNLDSNTIDTHMMKNIEWGAVAYLTQSVYGIYKNEKTCNIEEMSFEQCEIWINNTAQGLGESNTKYNWGGTYTGCVGDNVASTVLWNQEENSLAKCTEGQKWNQSGVKASTTGNMYGIYDMNGGAIEYVMGWIVKENDGGLFLINSDFQDNEIDSKYYDMYTFSEIDTTQDRGHLGDATREVLQKYGDGNGGWNSDNMGFPMVSLSSLTDVWTLFSRGGRYNYESKGGIFSSDRGWMGVNTGASFRVVLTAQDNF